MKVRVMLYFGAKENEYLDDEEAAIICDENIKKTFEWPAKPGLGERVGLGGNGLKVWHVEHRIKEGLVEVMCNVSLSQGAMAFLEDEMGWDMEELNDKGRDLLFQTARRIEKQRRERQ